MKWVEKEIGDKINFLRVNIRSKAGKQVLRKYNISLNSTYIIFDQKGKEIWRSYAIPLNGRKAVQILQNLI